MTLKIGVDLHGVIDANPELFKLISSSFLKMGHQIFIVSGPPIAHVEYELYKLGIKEDIHYSDLYTIVDFLRSIGTKMWQDTITWQWWASDEDWWGAKSKIAKELKLDIMVDNTEKYGSYFDDIDTKFILI